MMMANQNVTPEMMDMIRNLTSGKSMGMNDSSLPPVEDWCAELYSDNFMNDTCEIVYPKYLQTLVLLSSNKEDDPKDQTFKNRVKIGFGKDISLDFQISDDFTIAKMKATFMDYFKYAMVQTIGAKNSVGMDDCAEDCA